MMNTKLILASTSEFRRGILQKTGIAFEAIASDFDEPDPDTQKPEKYATEMARQKAKNVHEKVGKKDALIIGVDTLGALGKKIMGKPHSPYEAKKFLRELSGKTHFAISGLAIIDALSGREVVETVTTEVKFRELSLAEIDAYVRTGEPLEAAAGYQIQNRAALFVSEIKGDFYNVAGFPLFHIGDLLQREFKYNLIEKINKTMLD